MSGSRKEATAEVAELTSLDVSRLAADPSDAVRAEVAGKIALGFGRSLLNDRERSIALDIVRAMVNDAAVRVREALAENLKATHDLPHDVALALARDVESVSLPMLQFSSVLTEEDLVDIVRASTPEKQVAIASREVVPAKVADALIETRNEAAVVTLMGNEGAELSERALQRVLDVYGEEEAVKGSMVRRSRLPITVAERLVTTVSESLREYLVTHHDLSPAVVSEIIQESRERATVGLLGPGQRREDVLKLALQLKQNGRLTPSLILRALCIGDIEFFEASMAVMARITIVNARTLIHDGGELALKALYDRSELPPQYLPAIKLALSVAQETQYDGHEKDRERHVCRMIERILTQCEEIGGEENLDYLLKKLNQLAA